MTSPIGSETSMGHIYSDMGCNFNSTPVITPNSSHSDSTSKRFVCQECGQTSFSRDAELRRHISEQHRCPHEDCVEVKFVNSKDRDDHQRAIHHNRLGHRCGKCLLEGQPPNNLPRLDKLREHYRKVHHLKTAFEFFKCKHPSCLPSKEYGGLFFDSLDALEKHKQNAHPNPADRPAMSK